MAWKMSEEFGSKKKSDVTKDITNFLNNSLSQSQVASAKIMLFSYPISSTFNSWRLMTYGIVFYFDSQDNSSLDVNHLLASSESTEWQLKSYEAKKIQTKKKRKQNLYDPALQFLQDLNDKRSTKDAYLSHMNIVFGGNEGRLRLKVYFWYPGPEITSD